MSDSRHLPALLTAALVVLCCGTVPRAAAQVVNASLEASTPVVCNGRVGFRTSETAQHATDLNGDQDALDAVFQLLDLSTHALVPMASIVDASGDLSCGGDLFAFGVSEANQEADLDGDTDTDDVVLHVYDAAVGTLTNVGLPAARIVAGDQLVAFQVPEASVGLGGTDLDGDGDPSGLVLHVYDPASGQVFNVGKQANDPFNIKVSGRAVAFVASEISGPVVEVFDASVDPPTLTSTQIPVRTDLGIQFRSDVVAFAASIAQGDAILHVYCLTAGKCDVDPGLLNLQQDASGGFALSDNLIAFGTQEANQHIDLNGDQDQFDVVVQYRRFSDAATTNTHLAVQGQILVDEPFLAFAVPEIRQGHGDLNGDGDVRDLVVHTFDTSTGTPDDLRRAVSKPCSFKGINRGTQQGPCMAMHGDVLIFATAEKDQGRTDLNGDGDHRDLVPEVFDLAAGPCGPGPAQCPGLHTSGVAADPHGPMGAGDLVGAFLVSERRNRRHAPANNDLNGDGDVSDSVLAALNIESGVTTISGFAGLPPLYVETSPTIGDSIVFRVKESAQGQDLNCTGGCDFDRFDSVLFYWQTIP